MLNSYTPTKQSYTTSLITVKSSNNKIKLPRTHDAYLPLCLESTTEVESITYNVYNANIAIVFEFNLMQQIYNDIITHKNNKYYYQIKWLDRTNEYINQHQLLYYEHDFTIKFKHTEPNVTMYLRGYHIDTNMNILLLNTNYVNNVLFTDYVHYNNNKLLLGDPNIYEFKINKLALTLGCFVKDIKIDEIEQLIIQTDDYIYIKYSPSELKIITTKINDTLFYIPFNDTPYNHINVYNITPFNKCEFTKVIIYTKHNSNIELIFNVINGYLFKDGLVGSIYNIPTLSLLEILQFYNQFNHPITQINTIINHGINIYYENKKISK